MKVVINGLELNIEEIEFPNRYSIYNDDKSIDIIVSPGGTMRGKGSINHKKDAQLAIKEYKKITGKEAVVEPKKHFFYMST